MAISPLVHPASALEPVAANASTTNARSPLKNAASAVTSSNGTPLATAVQPDAAAALASTSLDLAERLNEEEKRKYMRGKKLGEGTYANVYLGHLRSDPLELVAIKKIKVQKEYLEGMAPDAVREIKFLQELAHPNIITLHSVFSSKDQNLNLVLEYLPLGDLEMLIRDTDHVHYGAADTKAWVAMLTRAVWFCHDNFVLHRDIKPNNCLIAADGEVKLADFGLARSFADPYKPMTSNVVTRWYRPPELLFGAKHYSGAVDVWSVGCLFAELITRAPYLPGNTELEQVSLICRWVGTPTDDVWPGVSKMPEYTVDKEFFPTKGRDYYMGRFATLGSEGVDLLMKTLVLDPKKRITAKDMLKHDWWQKDPKPTRKRDLPKKSTSGDKKLGDDLGRQPGVVEEDRGGKIARKLFQD